MGRDSELSEMGRALRERRKERGQRNLAAADTTGWTQHTEFHWSRLFNGKRLDYWPSRNRFSYGGRVMTGNVATWMAKRS